MRLLHTSDWHLGHRLHGVARDREHGRFLRWLVGRCADEAIDALIIAGDVFDSANPPAEAQRAYFQLLAACLRERPQMDIVVIGGNHDSPARLDAMAEVLRPLGVHVVGALPRDRHGAVDVDRALIPLRRAARRRGQKANDDPGDIGAWLIAVPYLRPTDWPVLPQAAASADGSSAATVRELMAGLRQLYDELFTAARMRRQPGQALVAVSHCLLTGGEVSLDSERRIQLGNSLPLPGDLFPDDVAYVALGHLHKAQRVPGSGHLRYSGSPIPLSFSERSYAHQVVIVDLEGAELREVRPLLVPRSRQILSIPGSGPALPLDELLTQLRALPKDGEPESNADDDPERPLLEVRVRLVPGQPEPLLRSQIEEALSGARPRLLRIACERPASGDDVASPASETPLLDLHPEEVFRRLYERVCADPKATAPATVPPAQLALFRLLLEQIESGSDEGSSSALLGCEPGGAP